jgi:dUTP pyrophosphatase
MDAYAYLAKYLMELNKEKQTKRSKKSKPTIKVVLDEGAKKPHRAHSADAGYDLFSREDAVIYPNAGGIFDTGVHVAIPEGYVGFLKSKSGLNVKHSIQSEGVIDSGYTGSINVKLFNHGSKAIEIKKGQKISQLVLLPIITPELELVDRLEETERGDGGFGSTGKF